MIGDPSNASEPPLEHQQESAPGVAQEPEQPAAAAEGHQESEPIPDSDNQAPPADQQAPTGQGGELEALRREHDSLRSQYVRIAADFDNFRKRQSRDQQEQRIQITCTTLSEILPVVDNFDRARQQLNPQSEEAQNLHRSYQGLYKQLVDVFKQLGVSPMRVEGEPFDPTLHEAVMREESHEHPEDIVIEELQRGYHLDGRVLRHALVKVSMGPGPADSTAAPETSGPVADNDAGQEQPS